MKRPMFFGAILACLCVTLSYLNIKATLLCGVGLICLLVAFAVNRVKALNYSAVIVALLVLISLINSYKTIERIDEISGERFSETFTVTEVQSKKDYMFVTAKCDDGKIIPKNTKITLFAHNSQGAFEMGDRFTANISIKSISRLENKSYYYSKGVFATGDIKSISKRHQDDFFLTRAGNIRKYVKSTLFTSMSSQNAATLLGITIGDKSLFDPLFDNNVKKTGVSHIMVVSGMHLTIILGALFWVLDRIFYHPYIRFLISFSVIVLLVSFCGFTLSIIRAGLMFLLLSLAPLLKRDNDSLNSFGTAMIIILVYNPFAILGVGFQLSALATFGIIYIVPFIDDHLKTKNKFLRGIIISLAVTLSATVMTLPVSIYNFGYVSLISPVTNILISIVVNIALCLAIIGLLINYIAILKVISDFVFWLSSVSVSYINYVINTLAKLPFAAVSAGTGAFVISLLLAFGIVLFISACKYKENLLKLNYNNIKGGQKV